LLGLTSVSFASDPALWGGLGDLNPLNTWTVDGTNWTEQFPATQPDITYYLGSTYDPALQQVIIAGGFDSSKLQRNLGLDRL
jgi:hypothetical protein